MSPLSLALVLDKRAPNPADVTQGWIGFVVFMGLAIGVLLLWLSFRKQLARIDFDDGTGRRRGVPVLPPRDEEPGDGRPAQPGDGASPGGSDTSTL